jgi:heptosyltransferase-2
VVHTVTQLLRTRFPERPVDILATTLCAPLTDYMPGLRQAIVADLPRRSPALAQRKALAARLKQEGCSTA